MKQISQLVEQCELIKNIIIAKRGKFRLTYRATEGSVYYDVKTFNDIESLSLFIKDNLY